MNQNEAVAEVAEDVADVEDFLVEEGLVWLEGVLGEGGVKVLVVGSGHVGGEGLALVTGFHPILVLLR